MSLPSHVVFSPNGSYIFLTLLSLGSACRLSVMSLHSVLHRLFSSHLLLPTHTSIWKTNSSFFVGLSFPFFSFPFLSFFFKANLHSTASNSLSPNFLPSIWPVCNLITPTTTQLNSCSCKVAKAALLVNVGPLFLSFLSALLHLTPFTSAPWLFFSAYVLLLLLELDTVRLLRPPFRSTFHFCLRLTSCTLCRCSI